VTLLGRVLKVQALAWFVGALGFGLAPRWLLEDVGSQVPAPDSAWLRGAAMMGFTLALLMVLIARRLEDVWWWAWSFAILETLLATVLLLNALFSLPAASAAWPWWTLGGIHLAFAALDTIGLARAGQEKPFV
jgi:hypothetical protein